MPLFFFHVRDDQDQPDLDGCELPDLAAARSEAVKLAGAILKEYGAKFWVSREWHMDVADSNGCVLFRLNFTASVAAL